MPTQEPHKEQLTEEAEKWIVRLRSDQLTQEDKAQFSSWLNRSKRHECAFDEALKTWELLAALSQTPSESTRASLAKNSDALLSTASTNTPGIFRSLPPWGAVAACTVLCLFSLLGLNWLSPEAADKSKRYSTSLGELRTITLEDGSIIELNTETILDVSYTNKRRNLTLVSGEAYFSVAPNEQKPFVVNFGNGSATAIGTAFNIYKQPSQTAVTVTEGVVDVREPVELAVPRPTATRVIADQQIQIGRRGVGPVKNIDASKSVAWRENTLIFKNTPLVYAIEELNRYLIQPAHFSRAELANLTVSGTFSLNSPSDTLEAISAAFNLETAFVDDKLQIYASRNSGKSE